MTTIVKARPEDPKSPDPFSSTGPSPVDKRSSHTVDTNKGVSNPRVRDPLASPVTHKGVVNVS